VTTRIFIFQNFTDNDFLKVNDFHLACQKWFDKKVHKHDIEHNCEFVSLTGLKNVQIVSLTCLEKLVDISALKGLKLQKVYI
jgi:hypothetical protein